MMKQIRGGEDHAAADAAVGVADAQRAERCRHRDHRRARRIPIGEGEAVDARAKGLGMDHCFDPEVKKEKGKGKNEDRHEIAADSALFPFPFSVNIEEASSRCQNNLDA